MTVLAALAAALREDGGLLAAAVADADGIPAELGAAAAAGPRAAGREDDYALLVEAIVEGYLQHYATGRVVRPEDPDLALLAGACGGLRGGELRHGAVADRGRAGLPDGASAVGIILGVRLGGERDHVG